MPNEQNEIETVLLNLNEEKKNLFLRLIRQLADDLETIDEQILHQVSKDDLAGYYEDVKANFNNIANDIQGHVAGADSLYHFEIARAVITYLTHHAQIVLKKFLNEDKGLSELTDELYQDMLNSLSANSNEPFGNDQITHTL